MCSEVRMRLAVVPFEAECHSEDLYIKCRDRTALRMARWARDCPGVGDQSDIAARGTHFGNNTFTQLEG